MVMTCRSRDKHFGTKLNADELALVKKAIGDKPAAQWLVDAAMKTLKENK